MITHAPIADTLFVRGARLLILDLRLTEEILHESIDARTEALATLRELGPPDLVHLVKASSRNPGKQVG